MQQNNLQYKEYKLTFINKWSRDQESLLYPWLPRHEHVEVAVVGYAENADEHVLKE
jgi:hypothetical protein